MSVEINPAISELDPNSLCYSIYSQLYHNFFHAQDKKDEAHPWGITEGDETSIRLKNTAYGFAEAIAGTAQGESAGGINGALLDYLKKTGGNMTGKLTANYGFEAGIHNTRILEAYKESEIFGIRITGNLEVGGNCLLIGGKQILSYIFQTDTAVISSGKIDFKNSVLQSQGEFIFGENRESGVLLSTQTILIRGNAVYHAGNANLASVDWSMKGAYVAGNMEVEGTATFSGLLNACRGVELGANGKIYLSLNTDTIHANRFLSFSAGCGIKIENIPVLVRINEKDIQLGAAGGDLHLGGDTTNRICLQANILDTDGDYVLLSKYGAAYFPDSLKVRHNYGDTLFSSYRKDVNDEGMIIHKKLRFGASSGGCFYGKENGIAFSSFVEHISPDKRETLHYETLLKYLPATSRYKPQNRISDSLSVETDADFILLNKPVEAKGHIGIDNSFTRLTDGCLFFTNGQYLLSGTDGIKHYGNAYFLENIASELFSSGFAGSGWAIVRNQTTGNVSATFDELTVRKKMRIYEMEVQKLSATNGALWISDCCSGDTVERIES